MDPKIWEGCLSRQAIGARSFRCCRELPPSALGEMLGKFPAMRQPLLAYASAPAVQSGISRAIMAVLQEDKQQQGEWLPSEGKQQSAVLKCYQQTRPS